MIELYTNEPTKALRVVPVDPARRHFIPHAYKCRPMLDANRFRWALIVDQAIVIENRQPTAGPGCLQSSCNSRRE